jgi:hypothetical protein
VALAVGCAAITAWAALAVDGVGAALLGGADGEGDTVDVGDAALSQATRIEHRIVSEPKMNQRRPGRVRVMPRSFVRTSD